MSFGSSAYLVIFFKQITILSFLEVCAAIYDVDNDWYRAIVSRTLSENEVEVF